MKSDSAILVVDDDPDIGLAARYALGGVARRVDWLASPDTLEAAMSETRFSAVLLDMNFAAGESKGQAGLDGLARIAAADSDLAVVLMTAYGGVTLAVEGLKRGAVDFVLKPWKNSRLVEAVSAAMENTASRRDVSNATLGRLERDAIRQALARYSGNISKAAEALGVTRPALYRKIEKHGL